MRYSNDDLEQGYIVEWCSPLPYRIISIYNLHDRCASSSIQVKPEVIKRLLTEEVGFSNWQYLDNVVDDLHRALDDRGCAYLIYNPRSNDEGVINIDNLVGLRVYICASADPDYLIGKKEIITKDGEGGYQHVPFIDYKFPKKLPN